MKGVLKTMVKLLDARTSQNASYFNSIAVPVTAAPQLFGTLGLNATGAGTNIRVELALTVAFTSAATVLTPVDITIYRGTGPNRVLIYSARETLPVSVLGIAATRLITVTAADFNPPAPNNLLVYQAFINTAGGVAVAPTRTGPESFYAAAYSD